ncbi:MAG TPA: BON domain-containing protein [Candidatus Dormibacteraeota bacterium]|jgi:osmotically-inducible protein OsmY
MATFVTPNTSATKNGAGTVAGGPGRDSHLTPRDVEKRILEAFHRSAEIEARGIRIETRDGTVTLHGQVRTWAEADAAKRAAGAAPGVSRVISELIVSSESPLLAEILG